MAASGVVMHMRTIPGRADWMALDRPLPCPMWPGYKGPEEVPIDFPWNGNSAGIFVPFYPRWNHPIASCRHDFRCEQARTPEERAWSDREYRKDVRTTGWWITSQAGYLGVRIGALLGIGSNFDRVEEGA